MLLLNSSKTVTVGGVTVYPDHVDPNQFWYLPGPVHLGRDATTNKADFTFIKYRPAAVSGGAKGGGFLTFVTDLHLDPALEGQILGEVSQFSAGSPRLAPVQFDEGTVQCIALNLQGSGGTGAQPAPAGAFNAVEKILGASVPSLEGDNTAAFSLTLSQEGAIILEQAFEQGTTPVGVLYNLKFTGLRPALEVKITADLKQVYDAFSVSLSGQYYFFKAGIDATFEWLRSTGAIKIEVKNFTSDGDKDQKEKWALDFFKDNLLKDWFEPTLSPIKLDGGGSSPTGSNPSGSNPSGSNPSGSNPSGSNPSGSNPSGGGQTTSSPASSTTSTSTSTSSSTTTGGQTGTRPAAKLQITSSDPSPLPASYGVTFTPSASGTSETLNFTGGSAAPTVTVNGQARTLDANRRLTVDVPEGGNLDIVADYASTPDTFKTFQLFFDYPKPEDPNHNWNTSPRAVYNSYLANNPNPADGRFSGSTAPSGNTSLHGADALKDWIQNQLAAPKVVTVDAYSSFESHTDPAHRSLNLDLSNRRRDVAVGIIGSLATVQGGGTGHGSARAEAAGRVGQPNLPADQDPGSVDRVAEITGKTTSGDPHVSIHARLSRDKASQPGGGNQGGGNQGGGNQGGSQGGSDKNKPTGTAGDPAIALKLKFVHQDEQKTLTLEYNRAEGVQRFYAPQGFFGLLLNDLADKKDHFVEVDLDSPFFREFEVTVDAPIDFQKIGLTSAHVALDYGDPANEPNHKHADFLFDPQTHPEQKFEVFMSPTLDTSYTYMTEYHFDPGSDWQGNAFSYQLPPKTTENRTLLLNPYECLGFLEVRVFPNRIDKGVVDSTDVFLTYPAAGAPLQQKTITLTPASQPQFWRLRLDDPNNRSYSYFMVHHLNDGSTRQTDPETSRSAALPVDDPFVGALEIDFIPLYDTTTTRTVFIDVIYDDPGSPIRPAYHREERLTLPGNSIEPVHMHLSLMDPTRREYQYRLTFVSTTNQISRGPFIPTSQTLISVAP